MADGTEMVSDMTQHTDENKMKIRMIQQIIGRERERERKELIASSEQGLNKQRSIWSHMYQQGLHHFYVIWLTRLNLLICLQSHSISDAIFPHLAVLWHEDLVRDITAQMKFNNAVIGLT